MKNIDLNDLQNIDFENIGSAPLAVRALLILVICILCAGAGYWFDTKVQLEELSQAERREESLKSDFETKQLKASNLDGYKRQLREMEETFGTMLRQLPSRTEVADLLVDITQTGLSSGLDFELFKPQTEVGQEFYAELPIALKVVGNFHEFGEFIGGVAALPRIVTMHDVRITASQAKGQPKGNLTMDAVAKTYRYLDETEIAAARSADKGKRKK